MPKTITQKIVFKNCSAAELYDLYMNQKKHSESIGAPVKITNKEGGNFSAYEDYITGKNLLLKKDKMIVQSWRGGDWKKADEDSIFMIAFETKGKDCILHVCHANLPDEHAKAIDNGWNEYYWKPWKKYLQK